MEREDREKGQTGQPEEPDSQSRQSQTEQTEPDREIPSQTETDGPPAARTAGPAGLLLIGKEGGGWSRRKEAVRAAGPSGPAVPRSRAWSGPGLAGSP